MKKLALACLALVFASALIGGCRAGGEVDLDGDVSYTGVMPK